MPNADSAVSLLDLEPTSQTFLDEVLDGLSRRPRSLPCKYFYDRRGSKLFDEICELDEYYLTRTELAIMQRFGGEMAAAIGPQAMLVEYGSGSSVKTRMLLDQLQAPSAYVPVDISRDHLRRSAGRLAAAYPQVEVLPVCADFTQPFELPEAARPPAHTTVYFPGSTIGNFTPAAVGELLGRIAPLCGEHGGLLIGVDLIKDIGRLEAAYNDRSGVTAEFNLNLLRRINRELDADFDLSQFEHHAFYNDRDDRVEIYAVSRCQQTVAIDGRTFDFTAGEMICTEHSHKYSIDGFAASAAAAGLQLKQSWTDDQQLFGVLYFEVEEAVV